MLLLLTVALGSIPELPAASCEEIKMSEGQVVASKKILDDLYKPGYGCTCLL